MKAIILLFFLIFLGIVTRFGFKTNYLSEEAKNMKKINAITQTLLEMIPEEFSGSILVTFNQEVFLRRAFGFADRSNEIANEVDTKFATASAGKFFVAIGIMKLIEKGDLCLSDTIGSILDINLNMIDPNITIHQLLSHTSGIPDYFDESVMTDYADLWIDFPCYRIRKSTDLLPLFINKPMMYPAGEKFQYNNSGYVVLGLVIEKITGKPFDEYLKKEVFDLCEMSNTGYFEMDRLPAKCAYAYIYDENRNDYYTNIFSVDSKGTGAGGAFTTVEDIQKLWNTVLEGGLVSNKILKKMFSVQASSDDDYYGYGVWLKKNDDRFIPFFQGYDPGVSFISGYDTKYGIKITIASNMCNDVWDIESKILNYLSSIDKKSNQ